MADRIVLINKGEIEQIAPPQTLFDRPDTIFAATFIGEPAMNTLPADLSEQGGQFMLTLGDGRIPLHRDWAVSPTPLHSGRRYIIGIRPQQMAIAAPDPSVSGRVSGTIFAVETLGSRVVFDVDVGGSILRVVTSVDTARKFPDRIGDPIAVSIDADFIYLFEAETGRTVRQARFTSRNLN